MNHLHFVRRHSALLALAAVLFAMVAAPYLVPIDPDSAVFRSGTFGALLLMACFLPVRDALARTDARTLLCAMLMGLLFSLSLSLGSELRVYQGLLPGMGSMMRRLAVPLLITPLLGSLIARAMRMRPSCGRHAVPACAYLLILLLSWLPALLSYFPAAINYDFTGQANQIVYQAYNHTQPMLHTLFAQLMLRIGELLGSRTLGLLLMTLVQMLLFASSLAYACVFAQRRGAPAWMLALMTLYFALHPIFSIMSISTTKDTLFASAILVLTLQSLEILEEGAAFFTRRRRVCLFVAVAACAAMLRSNGLAVLLLTFPALFIACRGFRKQIVLLAIGCALTAGLASAAIDWAFQPADALARRWVIVPAQQLVRAYHSDALPQEQKDEIRSWYVADAGLRIHPYLADGAKAYLDNDRLTRNGRDFFSLWIRTGLQCPREYIEAFLLLNIGSWYTDDRTHSTIYWDASWNDKGYLQTNEHDLSDIGLNVRCYLPAVRELYEKICRRNEYQKYPVISLLFNTAIPFWGIVATGFLLCARRRSRMLAALLCPIGLWGTYLFFGPCTLPRYILPLFCLAPVLLSVAYLPAPGEAG